MIRNTESDVLCVGFACIDINFSTLHHPAPREKVRAHNMNACGGGPASNAAITIARLGGKARFYGYIGNDGFGRSHIRELQANGVLVDMMRFGNAPTAIAAITIKPDGARSIICYRDPGAFSHEGSISLKKHPAKVLLVDGHQPSLSLRLVEEARELGIPSILDAGSINEGTRQLYDKVDYLVASSKFAYQQTGIGDTAAALESMRDFAPFTAVTKGPEGIYWQTQDSEKISHMKAFRVDAIDTTGAGDAFHGAFALGIAQEMPIIDNIRRASACGALTCLKMGARNALPTKREVQSLLYKSTTPQVVVQSRSA
ncbi:MULTISPECIES: PfkB family carbohydrate kinase [unclassified Lentimonas]|uniref:PfkB family carbohydrate kinase n=1 Tax=unclassified Lentimonas TaxID=2630993 RepID=UPI00132200C9|nr:MULTISPECIES: PfkB family carbohydrate kinase [unclassified Lentimonas]CAA6679827.1 Unannotated [Lentimonas sp. CC4]CAA6685661.1 Unannotated [Lentimonas sp. CC6]CAA7077105.1 Ribokinase (EC [Lentimonas sp. CC4]CAA7168814.1 Unannotated [Lentimonas sp. CC21]CAA7180822.1 Unannotated [Lentimonas sp. CC8]